jgi:hypothetical protein
MKLSEVEIQADGKKGTFFYTADDRVDFRELIKVYAGDFKVKVEMRQIGIRQEAAKVGGIGSCGRELCCSTWLNDFKSVNTTAARYQNLSINQTKLSGQCGRLKCCLNYELDTYLDALQQFPDYAETLDTTMGTAHLIKKDIFKNLMWYVLPNNTKHFPLTIQRVKDIKRMNREGQKVDELQPVEIVSSKQLQENEPAAFVDLVGQISLKTLEKNDRRRRDQDRGRNQRQGPGNNQGPRPQGPREPGSREQGPRQGGGQGNNPGAPRQQGPRDPNRGPQGPRPQGGGQGNQGPRQGGGQGNNQGPRQQGPRDQGPRDPNRGPQGPRQQGGGQGNQGPRPPRPPRPQGPTPPSNEPPKEN